MKHKIYLIPLLVAVIFISSCIPKPAGEVPTAETEQEKITERDDFGCFSSCKYFPEGSPRQMCEDWKAGKNVSWPEDCNQMQYGPCAQLCEAEKKAGRGGSSQPLYQQEQQQQQSSGTDDPKKVQPQQ